MRWSSFADDQLEQQARLATAIAVRRDLVRARVDDPAALDRDRASFEAEPERWMSEFWAAADVQQFELGDDRGQP